MMMALDGGHSMPQQGYGAQHGDYNPSAYNAGGAGQEMNYGNEYTPLQKRILSAVRACSDTNEGMNIPFLCRKLAPEGFNEAQIRDSIEWLIGEGHMYSTIDDDHCKTTDAGY